MRKRKKVHLINDLTGGAWRCPSNSDTHTHTQKHGLSIENWIIIKAEESKKEKKRRQKKEQRNEES